MDGRCCCLLANRTYNPADGRRMKKPATQEQAMKELVAVVSSAEQVPVAVTAWLGLDQVQAGQDASSTGRPVGG